MNEKHHPAYIESLIVQRSLCTRDEVFAFYPFSRCHTPEDHPLQCRRLIFLLPKAASQDGSSIQVFLLQYSHSGGPFFIKFSVLYFSYQIASMAKSWL